MVGLACALIVLLGAVAFAHYEMRTLGISRDNLEMTQVGRMSLDLLLDDLANAGAGIGYNESGQFAGFEVGQFTRGSAVFLRMADGRSILIMFQHLLPGLLQRFQQMILVYLWQMDST